jgi:hypothetical protein
MARFLLPAKRSFQDKSARFFYLERSDWITIRRILSNNVRFCSGEKRHQILGHFFSAITGRVVVVAAAAFATE